MHIIVKLTYFVAACYDMACVWLFVEFLVLNWSVRPRVKALWLAKKLVICDVITYK